MRRVYIADVALQRFPSLISKTFANIAVGTHPIRSTGVSLLLPPLPVTDPLQPLLGCLSHVQRMAFVHGDLYDANKLSSLLPWTFLHLRWIRGNRLSLLAHLLVCKRVLRQKKKKQEIQRAGRDEKKETSRDGTGREGQGNREKITKVEWTALLLRFEKG
eukprot:765149-Hanusia_phi.AAC.4